MTFWRLRSSSDWMIWHGSSTTPADAASASVLAPKMSMPSIAKTSRMQESQICTSGRDQQPLQTLKQQLATWRVCPKQRKCSIFPIQWNLSSSGGWGDRTLWRHSHVTVSLAQQWSCGFHPGSAMVMWLSCWPSDTAVKQWARLLLILMAAKVAKHVFQISVIKQVLYLLGFFSSGSSAVLKREPRWCRYIPDGVDICHVYRPTCFSWILVYSYL